MNHEGHGGSYRRNKDGSLTLVERTGWTPPKSKLEPKRRASQSKAAGTPKNSTGKGE